MTVGGALISVRDARFVYPGATGAAVDGVSVEIGAGEVVGVMGPNGSGKTTFTKLLNGLLRPTSGSVVVDGRDTTRHSVQALAAHVGYVFQNPNHQLFAATVAEELAFGPRNLRLPPAEVEARVAEAVESFGLGAVVELHPYRLSFPLRKLLGIASVYTMRPRVLILDEPTTGQDQRTARVIERLIAGLGERGDTVICVSHDMSLIAQVARRALVLCDGALIADGTPREVFADRAALERAHLAPPQVARLSARMPGRAGRPLALTVAELAAEVGGGPPVASPSVDPR